MASTTVTKNKQGYGYKYTDLSQIHEYLESINMKYYQYIEAYEGNDYIYTVPIKVMEDGTEKEYSPRRGCRIIQATLSGKSNPAQENGSAITYARRYSLLMAFGLATEDDDAASLTAKKPQQRQEEQQRQQKQQNPPKQETKTEEQLNQEMIDAVDKDLVPHGEGMTEFRINRLRSELKRTGNDEKTILGFYTIRDINQMTEQQYITCINQLMKKPDVDKR